MPRNFIIPNVIIPNEFELNRHLLQQNTECHSFALTISVIIISTQGFL